MDMGRNAGIEGIVDIAGSPSFGVKVLFWAEDTNVGSVDNTGQGDTDLGDSLSLIENGNVIIRGKVRVDLFPFPSQLKNAQGTVTFYLDKSLPGSGKVDVKMSATYRFEKVKAEYAEAKEKTWDITLVGQRVSELTPSGFANNATVPTVTARAAGNKYLYNGRNKLYDANTLVTYAVQVFNVWGLSADTDAAEVTAITSILSAYSTAPITSLKQHTASCQRLSSGVVRITLRWSLRSTADDVLFPLTQSTRSALNGYNDSVGSLVLTGATLSVATQINTLYQAFTAENFMWALHLRKNSDGKAIAKYEYRNPGIEERISARGSRWVEARVDSGNVQVYVVSNIPGGTGYRKIRFSPVKVQNRKVRSFVILRNLNSPTVPEDSGSSIGGTTLPNIGTINNATFQGIPAGQCIYDGPHMTVHLGMPGITSFPMMVGWRFRSDSLGIVEGIPQRMFNTTWNLPIAYTGSGWTNVSTLGAPFTSIVVPTSGDFTAFTKTL